MPVIALGVGIGLGGGKQASAPAEERIQNGTFVGESSAGWTLGAGWSVADEQLSNSGVNGNADYTLPVPVTEAGRAYTLTIDCVSGAAAGVAVQLLGSGTQTIATLSSNGLAQVFSGTATGTVTGLRVRRFGSGTPVVDNISLVI